MNAPKLPQQANPMKQDRISQAPYNFVPLPEQVLTVKEKDPKHDRFETKCLTGWLDLDITTETPLFVRCGPPPDKADPGEPRDNPARQQFFHHGDQSQPVIPGSSLRGMTRSLVEILAYGKLQWFSDQRLVYRAVGDQTSLGIGYRKQMLGPSKPGGKWFDYPSPEVRGGYLRQKDGHWHIQPALAPNGETFVHVEYGLAGVNRRGQQERYTEKDLIPVFVKPLARTLYKDFLNMAFIPKEGSTAVRRRMPTDPIPSSYVPAVIVRSGHIGGRSQKRFHCAIYEGNPVESTWQRIGDDLWRLYRDDRDMNRGIPARELVRDGDPLFYLVQKHNDGEERVVFFGPTMMFRLPYAHSIDDFVPQRLREAGEGQLDLAEAIFGTVEGKRIIKGRVFFHDAPWDKKGGSPFLQQVGNGTIIPKILSTPKPTSFQHYVVQPDIQEVSGSRDRARGGATTPAADTDRGHGLNTWDHPHDRNELYPLHERDVIKWHTDGTVVRGHKEYWHKPGTQKTDIEATLEESQRAPNQYTRVRPVRPCVTFCGRVSFENLSHLELGALLAALQLPGSMRHHLGMGKPLGMGSVRITATLHLTDRTKRYAHLLGDDGTPFLGEMPEADRAVKETKALEAFRARVIKHVNDTEGQKRPISADLWDIPRLKELAALLEWDAPPPKELTDYIPAVYKGGGNAAIQWWRERRVLPTPAGVLKGPAPVFLPSGRGDSHPGGPAGPSQAGPSPPSPGRSAAPAGSPKPAQQPAPPASPAAPRTAAARPTRDQTVTLLTDVRNDKAQVRTEEKAQVQCTGFGGANPLKAGDTCKADVSYLNGKPASAKFKGKIRK